MMMVMVMGIVWCGVVWCGVDVIANDNAF